ncbi:DHA1 family bicyclomycin/chloramphenicol resistance-like MFS transporter [Friedmanniella endophytica]|uniref:DHA1 family bicyclomycin/chloramphenicol resistance-like MFS transporter n=1 Tax=Microlunatus kandeliicorticis TaxID=1759536 RepID=A0A7W3P5X8_9ACTN|nr:multidrug effflux MFS transporter [Microlunatus kandeliicorticis]MBA8794461.1 DHA1 family bicyclomycin/chloramphenicol resistance-like MFS transporter [Microlunatus kandeliicorticis]
MTTTVQPTDASTDLIATGPAPDPRELTRPSERRTASTLGEGYVGARYLQLVLVLGALVAIGALTIDTYLPALPSLTEDFRTTAPTAQLTITGLMAGLGVGQLVVGPLSDAVGRRRPLITGLVAHGLMSVLCALAPTIELLIVARVLQGLAGAAVSVVAMAMVRDLFSGVRAARLLSRLTLVMGISPILAPTLGSALLRLTAWRGIFVFLAVVAALLTVLAVLALPETLPPARRVPARLRSSLTSYARLFRDPTYLIMVVVAGLMFATVFGYIGGSSFVLQEYFKLTPQQYGIAFGVTALGLIVATQINPALVQRFTPVAVLRAGVLLGFVGAALMVVAAATGFGGLIGFMAPLWITIAGAGLTFPNAPAIALTRHGESAGTAAALLGAAQFMISGISAPLVGALADGTPVPMAAVMAGASGLAVVLILAGRRLFADVEA